MTASLQIQAAGIDVTEAKVEAVGDKKVRVALAAKGGDVEVGCYFIRVKAPPGVSLTPELMEEKAVFYVTQDRSASGKERQLLDNGNLDEDREEGRFACTLDLGKWPPGRYVLEIGATNRPAPGEFVMDSRKIPVVVGERIRVEGDGQSAVNVPTAVHQIIFKEDGIYATFPNLMSLPDGRFGVTFSGRTVHSHVEKGKGSREHGFVSQDNGRTWQPVSEPLNDVLRRNRHGDLVTADAVGYVTAPASERPALEEQGKIIYQKKPKPDEETVHYLGGANRMTSSDDGKTWKRAPIALPENCRGLVSYLSSAGELVTTKGTRIRAVFGSSRPSPEDRQAMWEPYLLRSEDDGLSWQCLPMWPEGIKDPSLSLGEPALVETRDGTLVTMLRNAMPGGEPGDAAFLYRSESVDGGLTWTEPEKTPIWGFPASLLQLKDGRLLCVYGYRRHPMGIRAALSSDNGKTWDMENEMVLRADAAGYPGDTGYPTARQLPDESILVVYYFTTKAKPRNTHIAATRFKLPDRNGKFPE